MVTSDKYPILEFDADRNPLIDPSALFKPMAISEYCVLIFFQDILQKMHRRNEITIIKKLRSEMGSHLVYQSGTGEHAVALCHPGVGAPLAAVLLEELIALGCSKFIVCGSAGVLDSSIPAGHLLVPESAVREEGTSYHYLPPAREVSASSRAVQAITRVLKRQNITYTPTKTWTTDGIYRETSGKIQRRRSEGCTCVEMEAAALFAVAAYRRVDIGMLLYAGDDVSGERWQTRGWLKQVALREQLVHFAMQACLEMQHVGA